MFQEVVNWNKSTPVFGEFVVWTSKYGGGEFIKENQGATRYIYIYLQ